MLGHMDIWIVKTNICCSPSKYYCMLCSCTNRTAPICLLEDGIWDSPTLNSNRSLDDSTNIKCTYDIFCAYTLPLPHEIITILCAHISIPLPLIVLLPGNIHVHVIQHCMHNTGKYHVILLSRVSL